MAAEYGARSIMAAPLVVSNEAIGAAVFLHCSDPDFFNPTTWPPKPQSWRGQLGSLLEASRLTQVSREEHRRTKILAEVAQALRSTPESTAVVEAVADRLAGSAAHPSGLHHAPGRNRIQLCRAVAAESPQMAASVRARHDRRGLQFAADLASRAVAAGEPTQRGHRSRHPRSRRTGPSRNADRRALSHFADPGRGAGLSAKGRRCSARKRSR